MEFLTNLRSGWHVDQAILSEDNRLVIIRFGDSSTRASLYLDNLLAKMAPLVVQFAVIYLCDTHKVPDFNEMYELTGDDASLMFFWRNKHMMCDFGTGQNNKLDFPIESVQELVDIVETIYRGASKGKGLVTSPRDYAYLMKKKRNHWQ
ncbi:U4/U6-U5 snRNP complex subunit [Martiniozyma asiatica (nom. inval.)]|nr:U4/U6-U5 snRNP complex subunit [Martiniozyma asiatica]